MRILVTGGAGYIGSHTCVELLNAGHEVVILDNLCNASPKVVERIQEITGKQVTFCQVDLLDYAATEAVFRAHQFDGVIHFAGLKGGGGVGGKTAGVLRQQPDRAPCALLKADAKVPGAVPWCSPPPPRCTATPPLCPSREDFPLSTTNPYGTTKLMIEAHPHRTAPTGRPEFPPGAAAVLQPHRRPRERPHRGGPQRHPQQPDALHHPGRGGQAGAAARVRQRLSHAWTAPVCGITSMWWTWPRATSRRCSYA